MMAGMGHPLAWFIGVLVCLLQSAATDLGDLSDLSGLCRKPPGFPYADAAPRPFSHVCGTPTSAHFLMDASGVTYNGENEDEITMDIISQGPVHWSVSRFNQGDFAPRLGPKWEASQPNLGIKAPKGGSSLDDVAAHCSQAWRPHRSFGAVIPTVAKNGQDWGDGVFFGTVAMATGSMGYGYSMVDGSFGNGDCDVVVGKAGQQQEGNIDIAVAWFPYAGGFLSGYVAAPVEGQPAAWQEPGSHSPLLPRDAAEVVQWRWGLEVHQGGNHSVLVLPGYSSLDGMLFAVDTDGGMRNNDLNVVSVRPMEDYEGWQIQVHEDFDPTRFQLAPMSQWMFCFVFVPYDGVRSLHAVHVNGVTGLPHRAVGAITVQRISRGRYRLRIQGKGPLDGVFVLQCAARHTVAPGTLNAFISYEWNEHDSSFIVEVRHVSAVPEPVTADDRFPPSDADFFALWMDHHDPPILTAVTVAKEELAMLGTGSASFAPAVGNSGGSSESGGHLGFIGGLFAGVVGTVSAFMLTQAWRRRHEARGAYGFPISSMDEGLAPL